jgi:hypothetical protein
LQNWLEKITPDMNKARFNICEAYGSLPTDDCRGASYQHETEVSLSNKTSLLKNTNEMSARRNAGEDWHAYIQKTATMKTRGNILDSSIDWNDKKKVDALLKRTVSWPSYKIIQDNFEKLRDIRYFQERPDFLRRVSWLYPDDGCWTRAAAVIKDLFGPLNNSFNAYPRPAKVFAFGNLCVNTKNSPSGVVRWWYHTAPIIKDAATNQTYVLDPSIDTQKPLTMNAWVNAITSNQGECKDYVSTVDSINVCNGYGSGPSDQCHANYKEEANSMLVQTEFQDLERERLVILGRDADAILSAPTVE